MDLKLTSAAEFERADAPGAMPPEAPLGMPAQDLSYNPGRLARGGIAGAVLYARFILIAVTIGVTTYGVYQMLQVVRFASMTLLQGTMIFFFAVSLGWIAFAAGSVVAGASKRRDPDASDQDTSALSLTALVMPIYNEDPTRTAAALQAMGEALHDIDAHRGFEIVILSDSTSADAWIRETLCVDRLRGALGGVMPVWYRRRWQNTARKAGNLEDFVTRWGGRYDHMIVLDADSLIEAPALKTLVQAMRADPKLGILQTAPQLIGATTLFGRLQQFAACVYGPVITRGLAAWSGDSGNYWGHNAIIRVAAFAQHCGLPRLEGRKPFGGFVLSHDFVEAALMRRGGWKVRMATDCGGSWEESPPSLIDIAIRDRRWAQGNLQHMKIIGSAGLRFISRLHLGVGIMSYLSSPLWLLMLGIGFALAVQSRLIRPGVFQPRFPIVSDLAAVRRGVDDGVVLVQHGGAVDTEADRPGAGIAVEPHPPRRRRRHWSYRELSARSNSVGLICADSDGDSVPPCIRGIHGTRLRLEAAAPRLRHHQLGSGLALPPAPYAVELRYRRHRVFSLAVAACLGIPGASRPVSLGALVASQRQRGIGAFPFPTRAAAHAGGDVGAATGRTPR